MSPAAKARQDQSQEPEPGDKNLIQFSHVHGSALRALAICFLGYMLAKGYNWQWK